MNIRDFLLARIAEDEAAAHPKTVAVSGGYPAPEVPNCVGVDGRGCPERWVMRPPVGAPEGWWEEPGVQAAIVEHEHAHTTPDQKRALAECAAKRKVVTYFLGLTADQNRSEEHNAQFRSVRWVIELMATVYSDHPDYQKEWAV